MNLKTISTKRLYLIPFTIHLSEALLKGNTAVLTEVDLFPASGWPDEDMLETLPKIIKNLEKVVEPSGFESWMIIKKKTKTVIGDVGFKGRPDSHGAVDLGYAIVKSERLQGYAVEAAEGLIKWAFKQSEVKMITADSLLENTGSVKTLERLGFGRKAVSNGLIHWFLLREPKGKKIKTY